MLPVALASMAVGMPAGAGVQSPRRLRTKGDAATAAGCAPHT